MGRKKDILANTIIQTIVFGAIIVGLSYIIKGLSNEIVIDRIKLIDRTYEFTYGTFNLVLYKFLAIVGLVATSSLLLFKVTNNIYELKAISRDENHIKKPLSKSYFILEVGLMTLLLIFSIYLLFIFPRVYDKYNSYGFGFSLANVIIIITLLLVSLYSYFNKDSTAKANKMDLSVLTEGSVMAALAVVFSLLSKILGLSMPYEGSFSLSMLPLFIFALRRGTVPGLIVGTLYGLVNFITDGQILHWGSIFFDYLLPFGLLAAVTGLFSNKASKGLIGYTAIAVLLGGFVRYILHSFSGVLFFAEYAGTKNVWLYSFILYNLPYMLVSTSASLVITLILQKRLITLDTRIQ